MSEDKSAYRQIMKATSIFGGVQVFQILIGIIRSKFIAVLLGPAGMGVSGLLQTSVGMISSLTNFGLTSSAVKSIATAQAENNEVKVGRVIAVFRRLVWATGLLGAIITLILSPYLSKITFGNNDYVWAFAFLSITLLINQISAGQGVLLRAMRQIKLMAKSSMIGSVLGLLTTIPLYYFYGIAGIVPALIITALTSLFLSWYYSSKLSFKKVKVQLIDIRLEGKEMLIMGFMISLSGIISMLFSYLFRIYLSNYGSISDVGLYNAGFVIVNTYVGMIFTAMSTDYYPKLSSVANDIVKMRKAINQQAEIAILILCPIVLIFIVFIKWVIVLLYSEAFVSIENMVLLAAAGMIFKSISWAIAFLLLAKSASKLFFWNELMANSYIFIFNLLGYYLYGLSGLGASFIVSYIIYSIQVYLITRSLFDFRLSKNLIGILLINTSIISFCLFSSFFLSLSFKYLILGILVMVSIIYNGVLLNKRLGLINRLT